MEISVIVHYYLHRDNDISEFHDERKRKRRLILKHDFFDNGKRV